MALVALSLGLSHGAGSAASAADASSPPASFTRRMWMRGGILLAEPKGRAGWLVPDPVEVEVAADNRVRLIDGSGRSLTGYCPKLSDVQDIGLHGVFPSLGLYAQADAPLMLDPDGAVVGRALAGAFVPVQKIGRDWATVELPFVERGRRQDDNRDLPAQSNFTYTDDRFVIPVAALGMERKATPAPDSTDWIPKHGRVLRQSEGHGSRVFAQTWCLPGRTVDVRRADGSVDELIRYRFEGIEVDGWADRPLLDGDPDDSCARFVDGARFLRFQALDVDPMAERLPSVPGFVPNHFVPDGKGPPKALADAARAHRAIFVPVIRKAKLDCAAYRLRRARNGSWDMVAAEPPDPQVLRLEYGLTVDPGHVGVWGPTATLRRGGSVVAGCVHEYRLVRSNSAGIAMIPAMGEVSSYHPDDVEVWYADKSLCRERATFRQVSTACE